MKILVLISFLFLIFVSIGKKNIKIKTLFSPRIFFPLKWRDDKEPREVSFSCLRNCLIQEKDEVGEVGVEGGGGAWFSVVIFVFIKKNTPLGPEG